MTLSNMRPSTEFLNAAKNGELKLIKFLCESGDQTIDYDHAFAIALENNYIDIARYLFNDYIDINCLELSSLYIAIRSGYTEIVIFLADNGIAFNKKNYKALGLAVEYNRLEILKHLLYVAIKQYEIDIDSLHLLTIAATYNNIEIAEYLINMGVNIYYNNQEAKCIAINLNNIEIACMIGAMASTDEIKLSIAAKNGYIDQVIELVSKGTNIHHDHDFPFRIAAQNGHLQTAKFLEKNGANVHAKRFEALKYSSKNGHFGIVQLLIKRGAEITTSNGYALQMAVMHNHHDIVKLFIKTINDSHNINDEDWKEYFEETYDYIHKILHCAIKNGNLKIVKLLLSSILDDDINNKIENYITSSAEHGHYHLVKHFYSFVEKFAIDVDMDEAFVIAATNGHLNIVKFCLNKGANIKCNNGIALVMTKEQGNIKIYNYLKSLYPNTGFKDIANKVIELLKNEPFYYKWERIAQSIGNISLYEMMQLRSFANKQHIPSTGSKREICARLADRYSYVLKRLAIGENDTTMFGDSINTIPKPLLYILRENGKDYCFNIMELVQIINTGNGTNPFTRCELPKHIILTKYATLKKLMEADKLALSNPLYDIKYSALTNRESILRLQITNLLILLNYPPTVDQVLKMNILQVIDVFKMMISNPLFQYSVKKINLSDLINVAHEVLSKVDLYTSTRREAFEIYLNDVFEIL